MKTEPVSRDTSHVNTEVSPRQTANVEDSIVYEGTSVPRKRRVGFD
jgi:hypothetical protein